jgi:hypothetical protein
MIAAWNTVYLDQIVVSLREQGAPVPIEYLQHVSPLSWRHINFLGRYEFDRIRRTRSIICGPYVRWYGMNSPLQATAPLCLEAL